MPTADTVDVRGPRFGAAVTTVVVATALIVQGPVGLTLLAWQTVQFAAATFAGLRRSPHAVLFRVARRRLDLGPPRATEPEAAPRFAQACGLAVLTLGWLAFALGAPAWGWVAASVVLALSSLLAVSGVCVGCELYLWSRRVRAEVSR